MIESIKARLWETLREKEVSLVMVFSRDGRILWHRGRHVAGRSTADGEGFSRSAIEKALAAGGIIENDNVFVTLSGEDLPQSARTLFVKSLIIQQIDADLFLYVDSGIREAFAESDRDVFRVIGSLLADIIRVIKAPEGGLTGTSPAAARIRDLIARYSVEEEPVLLHGETGVGKNHVAEIIHLCSGRSGRFVTVNTPSIPEGLFESEIFGHRKGAFTGATETRRGLVDEADGGTLFLDEIGETPLAFQAKLLQFLDTRAYRVVGESRERTADVRLIAATNRRLEEEVRGRRFREDLYYRLNVLPIEIPPLRARREDIRALVQENAGLLRGKRIEGGFWEAVLKHDWPGNVRELIHVLKRVGIQIDAAAIGSEVQTLLGGSIKEKKEATTVPVERIREEIEAGRSFWDAAWVRFLERDISRTEIRALLEEYFAESGGSLKRMCERLHVGESDYPRFVSTLHKYAIHPRK